MTQPELRTSVFLDNLCRIIHSASYRRRILEKNADKHVRFQVECKDEVHPRAGYEGLDGKYRYSSSLPLTTVIVGGGWLMTRPSRSTPGEDPVTTGLEGAENLAQTGNKSPELPVRSEPLYRLRYPGPLPITWLLFLSSFAIKMRPEQNIGLKLSNIKCDKNPSIGSRLLAWGASGGHDEENRRNIYRCFREWP